jgi:hypothetical protein
MALGRLGITSCDVSMLQRGVGGWEIKNRQALIN